MVINKAPVTEASCLLNPVLFGPAMALFSDYYTIISSFSWGFSISFILLDKIRSVAPLNWSALSWEITLKEDIMVCPVKRKSNFGVILERDETVLSNYVNCIVLKDCCWWMLFTKYRHQQKQIFIVCTWWSVMAGQLQADPEGRVWDALYPRRHRIFA